MTAYQIQNRVDDRWDCRADCFGMGENNCTFRTKLVADCVMAEWLYSIDESDRPDPGDLRVAEVEVTDDFEFPEWPAPESSGEVLDPD